MSKPDAATDASDKLQKQQRSTRSQAVAKPAMATSRDGGLAELPDANAGAASWPVDVVALATEITKKVADMMDDKLSALSSKFDSFAAKYEHDSKRLSEAETRISTAEDSITDLAMRLHDAEHNVSTLTHRLNMQEARSRRDNLRVFGVKEGREGTDALSFFETWLPEVLNIQAKNNRIRLDRCHRGLGRPRPGVPRVVVMKLHNPTDKMKILRAYNEKRGLEYEGSKINIRQDIPQEILLRRREFNSVCQHLIKKKIKFKMRFPSTLCFTYNNQNHTCDSAEEAKGVLETHETTRALRDGGQDREEDDEDEQVQDEDGRVQDEG